MNDHDNNPNRTGSDKTDAVATGAGAVVGGAAGGIAGGAAAGAAVGGLTGPVGAVIGAVAGAAVGALAGKGVANAFDPAEEDKYWRNNYSSRPYASGASYDDYGPAYRYGVDTYNRYPGQSFDEVEGNLGRDWDTHRGTSSLEWERAKHASRDAWHRLSDTVERAVPGDSDRDGK
ncbi:hypothetical protein [Caldimonas tepidiphila]|uniref:hypothetical protein n=1 Tax=Caldimonas tepidiphila TaxID=2315841 RepID=UPI000E5AD80E|nr:hypothetical protein [Caldimonas tepidiphila]